MDIKTLILSLNEIDKVTKYVIDKSPQEIGNIYEKSLNTLPNILEDNNLTNMLEDEKYLNWEKTFQDLFDELEILENENTHLDLSLISEKYFNVINLFIKFVVPYIIVVENREDKINSEIF